LIFVLKQVFCLCVIMDPLSIASASAGLLSLGLTVCNGLLEYYSAWKGAEGDVAKMYLAIQALTKSLILIKSAVDHKEFNRNIVAQVEESITSTRAGIDSLKKKLDKIRISSPEDGWREKSKVHLGRTLFPFKESTLVKLKEVSNELRDNLSLALNVLQM
jgi:ankyrin repeat domain-containing protein 50